MNLLEIRNIRSKIESLEERMARLQSAMESGAQQLKDTPGCKRTHDKLADDMAKMDELRREHAEAILTLEREFIIIESEIATLPAREQMIRRLRYIGGLSWYQISEKANYSIGHCKKINAKATKMIRNDTI